MPVAKHSYDQTASQISELKKKRDDLKAIVECYEDIFKAQNEIDVVETAVFDNLVQSSKKSRKSHSGKEKRLGSPKMSKRTQKAKNSMPDNLLQYSNFDEVYDSGFS